METPFCWTLEADEIENVPKRQKTEEIHVQARDTDIKPQNISLKNTVGYGLFSVAVADFLRKIRL